MNIGVYSGPRFGVETDIVNLDFRDPEPRFPVRRRRRINLEGMRLAAKLQPDPAPHGRDGTWALLRGELVTLGLDEQVPATRGLLNDMLGQ